MVIDPTEGSIRFDGLLGRIAANSNATEVRKFFGAYFRTSQDHYNGYEWLYFDRLGFGGRPCSLGVCFFQGQATGISWSVSTPDFTLKTPWPSRSEVDLEIEFVRQVLAAQLARDFASGLETFPWGRVGCVYDDKSGGVARSFVDYPK
jgi:hypothetical protein